MPNNPKFLDVAGLREYHQKASQLFDQKITWDNLRNKPFYTENVEVADESSLTPFASWVYYDEGQIREGCTGIDRDDVENLVYDNFINTMSGMVVSNEILEISDWAGQFLTVKFNDETFVGQLALQGEDNGTKSYLAFISPEDYDSQILGSEYPFDIYLERSENQGEPHLFIGIRVDIPNYLVGKWDWENNDVNVSIKIGQPTQTTQEVVHTLDSKYLPQLSYNNLTDKPEEITEMGASGTNHKAGLVPDPGATQGNTKFLREDGTWANVEIPGNLAFKGTVTFTTGTYGYITTSNFPDKKTAKKGDVYQVVVNNTSKYGQYNTERKYFYDGDFIIFTSDGTSSTNATYIIDNKIHLPTSNASSYTSGIAVFNDRKAIYASGTTIYSLQNKIEKIKAGDTELPISNLTVTLSPVANTGDYQDLVNKPSLTVKVKTGTYASLMPEYVVDFVEVVPTSSSNSVIVDYTATV